MQEELVAAAAWGTLAFGLSLSLTVVCMPLARRFGVVARPRADRWHRGEIPLLGGVAIALGTIVPLLFADPANPRVLALVLGGGLIAATGLIDDVRSLRPQTKLLAQLLTATLALAMGLRLELTGSAAIDATLTLVWIVGLTNAFNLLDNMDGLAAGIAAIAAAFQIVFFQLDGNAQGIAVAAVLLGATLGFLVFNRPPARIFMGDAGSMCLGFLVAGLSLVGTYPYSRGILSIVLIPVLVALVPIFDTAFVTATRILAGRPISVGGRDHTSHRLVALGLSEKRAVGVLYLLAIASGTVAYLSGRFGFSRSAVLLVFLVVSLAMLALHLSSVDVHPAPVAGSETRGSALLRAVTGVSHFHQALIVLVDFALIVAAYQAAYLLRFEGEIEGEVGDLFLESLPIVIACQLGGLTLYRAYQGVWRYTSVGDLLRLIKAVTFGTVLAVCALALVYRFEGFSRAVFALDWLLVVTFLCGSRISFRFLAESLQPTPNDLRRVLVYGAGAGGELAVREMQQNPSLGRLPIAFVDDDSSLWNRRIRGVPVAGGGDAVGEVIRSGPIDEVVVSSSKIPGEQVRRLARTCEPFGVRVVRVAISIDRPELPD